jgi:ornithine carbamoyltransferase
MVYSTPPGYEPDTNIVEKAKSLGGDITYIREPEEAVNEADVIYTDVWTSMGQEEEREKRLKVFSEYQVNMRLLEGANEDVIVLHCLPAHRGEEITDEVIESSNSVIYDQSENRLHAQKAILLKLIGEVE